MEIRYDFAKRGYEITLFIGDREFYEASKEGRTMDYYKLPKDDRWLEGDSPYSIGGRDTDISQIAYSLSHRVRELFPINTVPQLLVTQLDILQSKCEDCEKEIQKTIGIIQGEVARQG